MSSKFPGDFSHDTQRSGNVVHIDDYRKRFQRRNQNEPDNCEVIFAPETQLRIIVMRYLLTSGQGADTTVLEEMMIREATILLSKDEHDPSMYIAQASINIVKNLYEEGLKNLQQAIIRGRDNHDLLYTCAGILSYAEQKIPSLPERTYLRKNILLAKEMANKLPESQRLRILLQGLEERV